MIDIPLNKALVAVEANDGCRGCYFLWAYACPGIDQIPCKMTNRKDGKNVIFKIIDLPVEGNNGTA